MDLTFDIASLIAIFTIVFAYNEMKNNKKAELTRQQEKEKAQIQLLIIDWVHGEPFSSTEKNNNGLWGIRISNYSQTAFRDFTLSFQDKMGNYSFYAPYIRPGDFFLDKQENNGEIYYRLRAVETFNMHFDTLSSIKYKSFPDNFNFQATCEDIENCRWKIDSKHRKWQKDDNCSY